MRDQKVLINGHEVYLAEPTVPPPQGRFVGRAKELRLCRAAWCINRDGKQLDDDPSRRLHFSLQGAPGVGKNEIVYQLARDLGLPLFMIQGHEELTPEDLALVLVPHPEKSGTANVPLVLRASPLATALYTGGLFFFDEINRVPERSLAPLASVLDDRLEIFSAMTGLRVQPRDEQARRRFRFCCALNPRVTETGVGSLPDYIAQRTLPVIKVGPIAYSDLRQIISLNLNPSDEMLAAFERWYTEQAHPELSVREALNLMRYALTQHEQDGGPPRDVISDAAAMFINPNQGAGVAAKDRPKKSGLN